MSTQAVSRVMFIYPLFCIKYLTNVTFIHWLSSMHHWFAVRRAAPPLDIVGLPRYDKLDEDERKVGVVYDDIQCALR